MKLHNWVNQKDRFIVGIHKPSFTVANQRENDRVEAIGRRKNGGAIDNRKNFPAGAVDVEKTAWIFEIPNPFSFRGVTYIKKDWADKRAADPSSIRLPPRPAVSLAASLGRIIGSNDPGALERAFRELPEPMLLAAATISSDPADLIRLAGISCSFVLDRENRPTGLVYESAGADEPRPLIHNHPLFEAVANNPSLPAPYKVAMVLRPGAQGGSEIVGEARTPDSASHVFEYLRRNSYIAWGHYAANMADDTVRYSVGELSEKDIAGLRRLYYQRTFLRMAEQLKLEPAPPRKSLTDVELEELRTLIVARLREEPKPSLRFKATLWGWNYGFDFAPTLYRLHASHQQIHQQFAMIPAAMTTAGGDSQPAYGCGDLVADSAERFRAATGRDFFASYLTAIHANTRTDGRDEGPSSLIVHQDEKVILFVPKAQTSQWELQLICLDRVGNIVEADAATRKSLDHAMLVAMKTFDALGARLVTTIEFPKRFDAADRDQRLLYSFLPKLPESPGTFSEAQLRWINGHYPEDFAEACRQAKKRIEL
ncbi:MAG: hypothetical protein RQ753_05640 [Desulfurivibrionaceae bacterium]|nr:hypothetical protein [Desulfobulbales bacterium]MDT8335159.1 hypothetical protein [Desulfurivibrionaceae bacterium]